MSEFQQSVGTGGDKVAPSQGNATPPSDIEIADAIRQQLPEMIREIVDQKAQKTTEMMAIFITLFTFISVNVNVFSNIESLGAAVWFMILMAAASSVLIAVMFFLIDETKEKRLSDKCFAIFAIASCVFLICLILSLFFRDRTLKIPQEDNPEVFLDELFK